MCTRAIKILLFSIMLITGCYRDQPSNYNVDKIEYINLIYPRGGERFGSDQIIPVMWKSSNINSSLRIQLIDSSVQVFSVSNIPDTGSYDLQIPSDAIPSKNYKLVIVSMQNPEVSAETKSYFEIVPVISGHWFYSNVEAGSGLEISLDLSSYIGNSFLGEGTFYFKYPIEGGLAGYESNVTVNGILEDPQVGFKIIGDDNREFDLTGEMIGSGEIRGRITGMIDDVYGNIADSLTLTR